MDLKNILKKVKLAESTVSTILGIFVVIVVGFLIFRYFQGLERPSSQVSVTEEEKVEEKTSSSLPIIHEVKSNENLWKISLQFYGSGYNWVDIATENKIENPDIITVGSKLTIPKAEKREPIIISQPVSKTITEEKYTVVKGDSLWKIALRAYGDGFRWQGIAQANHLVNPKIIHPGNVLVIPR